MSKVIDELKQRLAKTTPYIGPDSTIAADAIERLSQKAERAEKEGATPMTDAERNSRIAEWFEPKDSLGPAPEPIFVDGITPSPKGCWIAVCLYEDMDVPKWIAADFLKSDAANALLLDAMKPNVALSFLSR